MTNGENAPNTLCLMCGWEYLDVEIYTHKVYDAVSFLWMRSRCECLKLN